MGAKNWMLGYSRANAREALTANPVLDRDATLEFVAGLFPNEKLEQIADGIRYRSCGFAGCVHRGSGR